MAHPRHTLALVAASVLFVGLLAGCAPETTASPSGTPGATPLASDSATPMDTPTPTASGTPSPTETPAVQAVLPTDCRAILNDAVLAQLKGVPLNDPGFGASGVQSDSTLICIWGDPGADTTHLGTTISRMNRGTALDTMNALAESEGFSCYTPDGGTRCEKTWQNMQYPVTDGRTLFWRDDVMVDTEYSNLAPSGYTDAIIASVFG